MKQGRRSILAALVLAPFLISACGDGGGGTTDVRVPSAMQKTAGDNQSGPPGTSLSDKLEVKVTDEQGRAVPDFTVSFSTTDGSVNPQSMDTDSDGRARTTLTLPTGEATVTVTASGAGVPSVQFTAHSVPAQLGIVTSALPAGRTGISYTQSVEAVGGSGAGYSFDVSSGSLPPGVQLQDDGTFAGTPSSTGTFTFTVSVTDSDAETASRPMTVEVCAVPADLAVGQVRILEPSEVGKCGAWIPNDQTERYYRLGVIRTNRDAGSGLSARGVTITVSGFGVSAGFPAPASAPALRAPEGPSLPAALDARATARLRQLAARQAATERHHERLLRQADELLGRLGPDALVQTGPGPAAVAATDLPDELQLRVSSSSTCDNFQEVTAVKLGENDHVAIYQDAEQFANTGSRVSSEAARQMLDYYENFGKPILDAYFDGVPDIDSNGKVIAFISPEAADNVLGFVWPGDMFTREQCAASNEAELVYLGVTEVQALDDPDAQFALGLAALVHEMKHVSSLWERLQRNQASPNRYHPLWLEEGSAEIASTKAARLAWAAVGGPGPTERVLESHWRDQPSGAVTSENVALLLQLFRLQESLYEQPNSLITNTGLADDIYGTGWLFLRWLGDAYGDAASGELAEASLFSEMNDRTTQSGVPGVEAVTGTSWETLLEEFTAAIMYNGTPAMETGPKPITSWDFVSAIELWCFAIDPWRFYGDPPASEPSNCNTGGNSQPGAPGAFPWPVTVNESGTEQSVFLETAVYQGDAGQGGFRVHDFFTNGTGSGAEVTVDVQPPASVVLVRVR